MTMAVAESAFGGSSGKQRAGVIASWLQATLLVVTPVCVHAAGEPGAQAAAAGPAFDCHQARTGSIEALVCADAQLSALDRRLAGVYAEALTVAVDQQPPLLKAEQRGWIKGRNECWKAGDQKACVRLEYERRMAELQARYRLVAGSGPVAFACDGNPANEVIVTFFATHPPTLIAERGDSVSLMYLQPSASGSRYQGRNESFREHKGQAMITWGYDAPAMRCERAR